MAIPIVGAYEPTAQDWQALLPAELANVPTLHGTHVEIFDAPTTLENVPLLHGIHAELSTEL